MRSSNAQTCLLSHPHYSRLPPSTTLSAYLLCFTLIPRCLNLRIVPDHGNIISVMGPHHHHPSVAYPSVAPKNWSPTESTACLRNPPPTLRLNLPSILTTPISA